MKTLENKVALVTGGTAGIGKANAIAIDALSLMERHTTIRGMEVANTQDFQEMNQAIKQHDIHPAIDRTFTFDEVRAAFTDLEQGKHFGKIAIQVSPLAGELS